ncbi:domain family 1 isoform X1 [Podarcis lilfordi]|uniref:TSC22 domain family protein 1 n=1 Tax=Podarcis lilfordi TaxID=74358 RepID=A0AA35K939_9SAUR|nr:domain family 1 isoform X1 [Podarcis lilfordi]
MHQPDSAADTSVGKMAHPAMLPRRGSSSGGGGGSSSSSSVAVPALCPAGIGVGGSSGGGLEDYSPPLLVQPPPPPPSSAAPSSSPGLPPPQSLTLLSTPQPLGQAGAQMKKKSGFQITSVTPAQISASLSSNNSIAEDTESYDDLDESHTEDLSSSEILDVSLSRATDLGEPERSSSEETLNNFQEAESPGAVSPNQPRLLQQQQQQHPSLPHPSQHQSVAINGSMHPSQGHHYHHHHHGHHHAPHSGMVGPAAPGGPPFSPSFRKLSTAASSDSVVAAAVPVSAASSAGMPVAALVSHFHAAGTPGVTSAGGATASTLSSETSGSSSGLSSMPGPVNVNLSNFTSTGSITSGSVNVAVSSGLGNGTSTSSSAGNSSAGGVAAAAAAGTYSQLQPAASTSRFRVVKLDSSSEPFKKGRWTCTEFYDKENLVPVAEGVAVNKALDTLKQNSLDVTSERESTSGSSVSSNVSTLSHYTESVGSGEMGAPAVAQPPPFQAAGSQQLDFGSTGPQPAPAPSIPQSVSQPQLAQPQLHPQDVNYPPQKQGVQPPASAVPPPVNIVGGHQQPAMAQQLPYTQSTQPVPPVPVVPQLHQLPYGQGQAQHPPPQQQQQQQQVPLQMAPGHVKPVNQNSVTGPMPDYVQQQQMLQTPASMQPGPTMVGTAMPAPVAQAPSMQPSVQAHLAVASSQPAAHAQTAMLTSGAGAQTVNVGQQGSVPPMVQQPAVANPIAPSVVAQSAPPPSSHVVPPVPAGVVHPGLQGSTSSLPQPLVIVPQSTLLPVQAAESLVPGMAGQQLPAVSPVPSASAASVPGQSAANVLPTPMSLPPSKNIAQSSSGAQNGNLVQNVSTSINLPAVQNVPQQVPLNSAQFSAQSLVQSITTRSEDSKRSTEPTLVGLPQTTSGESGAGASSAMSDGASSTAASLFPLKALPLTVQLVDGEDESSSGASVVAIDNKIEQAMDLVKSHLMYAVREEVEVLKEQIKELIEKNNQLEQENNLLKTLASPEQLAQFQAQLQTSPSPAPSQPQGTTPQPSQPTSQGSGPSA